MWNKSFDILNLKINFYMLQEGKNIQIRNLYFLKRKNFQIITSVKII